jgi:hypothetical protein
MTIVSMHKNFWMLYLRRPRFNRLEKSGDIKAVRRILPVDAVSGVK